MSSSSVGRSSLDAGNKLTLKEEKDYTHAGGSVCLGCLEVFCKKTCPSPSCIYLLHYLYQYGPIDTLQIVSRVPLTCPSLCLLSTSLLSSILHAPNSSCIFPASALELASCPRSPDSFYWRVEFRNQDLGAGCSLSFKRKETGRVKNGVYIYRVLWKQRRE